MKRKIAVLAATVVLCVCVNYSQTTFVDGVDITTTKAPWTLRILGNDLDITGAQAKPDQQSAYFMMASGSSGLNVSVFIEPVDKCKTSEGCRDYVLDLGNPAWGKFQDLAKSRIKDFHYFEFYRPEVMGRPMKMFDIYAEYVDQGYWVDVHISKPLYTKPDHALFEKVINSISFVRKNTSQATDFDAQKANGDKGALAWLGIWDKIKCRESYLRLDAVTRAQIGESLWVEYCEKTIRVHGANSSRKPIAVAYTKSLPPKIDRPVAVLAYHSDFANRAGAVELVALVLSKDGNWLVTNYLLQ